MVIRDRAFIQVKKAQSQPDDVLAALRSKIRLLPGRIAVVDDLPCEQAGLIVLPSHGRYEGSHDSDTGIVVASGHRSYPVGARVAFKTLDGLQMNHNDADWIPEGCRVRFFGVTDPVSDSVVGIVE